MRHYDTDASTTQRSAPDARPRRRRWHRLREHQRRADQRRGLRAGAGLCTVGGCRRSKRLALCSRSWPRCWRVAVAATTRPPRSPTGLRPSTARRSRSPTPRAGRRVAAEPPRACRGRRAPAGSRRRRPSRAARARPSTSNLIINAGYKADQLTRRANWEIVSEEPVEIDGAKEARMTEARLRRGDGRHDDAGAHDRPPRPAPRTGSSTTSSSAGRRPTSTRTGCARPSTPSGSSDFPWRARRPAHVRAPRIGARAILGPRARRVVGRRRQRGGLCRDRALRRGRRRRCMGRAAQASAAARAAGAVLGPLLGALLIVAIAPDAGFATGSRCWS